MRSVFIHHDLQFYILERVAQRQLKVNNTYKILEKNKEFKTFIFDNKHRKKQNQCKNNRSAGTVAC